MRNASSSLKIFGASETQIQNPLRTPSRKNITGESPTRTNTLLPAYRVGRRIVGTCTFCGGRRMKLSLIQPAARMTVQLRKAAEVPQLIRGKNGDTGIWKVLVKTWR